jgi:hypothetical protein
MTPLSIMFVVAVGIGCAPIANEAGEGEGEGEPSCANGRLRATAGAEVDVDTCLSARASSEDNRELTFSLDETFTLQIISNVDLVDVDPLPLVLDDDNSSTIASYDDGTHVWRISDGQLLGVPTGEAVTTIEAEDDDGVHGVFDGAAFDNDGDELVDPMTLRVDF